jgi:hypothetical protein
LSHQGAYKFNSLGEIPVKKSQREDSHSTDKQPDKSCPKGNPDVNDKRARHVDAIKISRDVRPLPEYA